MKKSILLFLLSFGITVQCFAQDDIKIINLNFRQKKFDGIEELEKIKKGEYYQLKIDSINLNLYKVTIETKDTTITSSITFPTFDMASLGGIGDILSKLNEVSTSEKFLSNEVQQRIKYETIFIQNQLDTIQTDQERIESLMLSIQSKILSYSVLVDPTKMYYSTLSNSISIDSVLYKTNQLKKDLSERKKQLKDRQSDYTEFISADKTKRIIEKDTELKKSNSIVLESFTSSINLTDTLAKSISTDKIMTWLTILINKENNTGPYISMPQQLNGSETKLKIIITPQEKESSLQSYMTTIKFPQRKTTYVGIGMGFYGATFKSNTYSTSATVIDSAHTDYKIVNENSQRGEIGLVTLLHFGWRPCKKHDWFALNLSTGPALSFTSTVKPRIALGGGVSFGRNQQMLSISALYMAGYVDQKSNVYDTNTTYNSKPNNVTVNKLAGAFGLSLGYVYKF